jgi:hypothetical protein
MLVSLEAAKDALSKGDRSAGEPAMDPRNPCCDLQLLLKSDLALVGLAHVRRHGVLLSDWHEASQLFRCGGRACSGSSPLITHGAKRVVR